MAIVRNLATVKTTADITSSATSIPVNRVDVFGTSQTTLDNPFYVTIMPASGDEPANSTNSEIVLVTGISGSNLTVTRGQRSTTAKAFNSGAIVTMAIYAEDAVLLGDGGTDVGTPAPWINTSDIKNGAITTDKIADGAVKPAKIDFTKLYKSATPLSATLPVQAQTETDVQSFSLPAGKWRIFWSVRGYGDYHQADTTFAGLKENGVNVQSLAVNGVTIGALRPYISCSYEANITSSTTFSTYVKMVMAGNISVETTYLFALRVG